MGVFGNQPTLGDQLRGYGRALRQGGLVAGMSPIALRRAAKEVRDERLAREGAPPRHPRGYYSRYRSADGRIDVFIDRNGNQTTTYPHVHVVHREGAGGIVIIASKSRDNHPYEVVLPGNASGNRVNRAIDEAISKL